MSAQKRQSKKRVEPMRPTREMELNQRQAPVSSNRVATYASPFDIRIRFLHAVSMGPTLLHPVEAVQEIVNVADIVLHPSVAKRLLVDLKAAVDQYEQHMGIAPTQEEGEALWLSSWGDKQ